jgi:hypothetical protein
MQSKRDIHTTNPPTPTTTPHHPPRPNRDTSLTSIRAIKLSLCTLVGAAAGIYQEVAEFFFQEKLHRIC